jgi:hypothetical protein
MAIIQYSSLVNKIIGKVGGVVFQRMGQTSGIRAHVHHKPSNTNTNNLNRFNMQIVASFWNAQNYASKQAWIAAQATFTFYNKYGSVIQLTAYQFFMYIQKVAIQTGLALNGVAFSKVGTGLIRGPITAVCNSSTGFFITYTNPINTTVSEIISVSKPQISPKQLAHPKVFFIAADQTAGYTSKNLLPAALALWGGTYPSLLYITVAVKTWSVTYNQWVQENSVIIRCM